MVVLIGPQQRHVTMDGLLPSCLQLVSSASFNKLQGDQDCTSSFSNGEDWVELLGCDSFLQIIHKHLQQLG